MVLEIALLVGAALGGAATVRSWPVLRLRRRARRAAAPVERERRAAERAAARAREELVDAAQDWADAVRARRVDRAPVRDLNPLIDAPVQWSALEEAGYERLRDLQGLRARQLEAVRGVGRASARRLVEARDALQRELRAARVRPPTPDADAPEDNDLRRAAYRALFARDQLGPPARELDLSQERAAVRAAHGLARAAVLGVDGGRLARAEQAVERLEQRARERSQAVDAARRARGRLATELGPGFVGDRLVEDHTARYADYSALIEEALGQRAPRGAPGAPPPGAPGGLPEKIAARVEAQPLEVGSMRVTLRGYQAFGARYLLAQRRTILGDEMGLGKTIQALAAMTHQADAEGARRFLVVAPAGVLFNWVREVRTRTALAAHLLHGDERGAALARWRDEGGVAITSFGTLRVLGLDGDEGIDGLVVDEAHYVKNPAAQRTAAVAAAVRGSGRVCLMSGTPMENRLSEFASLVGLVQPKLVGALDVFEGAALTPDRERFQEVVAPAYLRRNKEDVLDELPERIDVEEWVELSREEQAAYREEVAARNFMGMRRAVTALPLRRAAPPGPGSAPPSAKLERVADLVEEYLEDGRKVLVFSFFLDVLERAEQRLGDAVLGTISGSVAAGERQRLVDAFTEAADPVVLLLQIDAGGVGLNLQAASAVILMEPQWKPSTEEQAIARAHRMGQHRTVTVHRMLAKDSVDERMLELLEDKQDLFEAYARPSAVKEVSDAATERSLAQRILDAEAERLGATPPARPSASTPPLEPEK